MRFLMYTLGDERVPIPPPTPELVAEMDRFVREMKESGALIATGALAPSSEGAIVRLEQGEFTVTDGPFAEAKELVGGWALVEAPSLEAAIEQTKRFLSIVGGGEARIRPVYGDDADGTAPAAG